MPVVDVHDDGTTVLYTTVTARDVHVGDALPLDGENSVVVKTSLIAPGQMIIHYRHPSNRTWLDMTVPTNHVFYIGR